MLHDYSAIADQDSKIGDENIFLSSNPQMFGQVLSAVKDGSAHSRFFIGTSAWLPGQLDNEIRCRLGCLCPLTLPLFLKKSPMKRACLSKFLIANDGNKTIVEASAPLWRSGPIGAQQSGSLGCGLELSILTKRCSAFSRIISNCDAKIA